MITAMEGINLAHLRSKDRGCGSGRRAQEADLPYSLGLAPMAPRPERGWGGAGGERAWGSWSKPRGWKGGAQQEVRGQEASAPVL